jgi:hypothetical protein
MPILQLVVDQPTETDEPRFDLAPMARWFQTLEPLGPLDSPGVAALLRDLSFAFAELISGRSSRAVIPTEAASPSSGTRKGAVWEIGIERDGADLLVSLFRQGVEPQVAQTERCVSIIAARRALLETIGRYSMTDRGLALARETLLAANDVEPDESRRAGRIRVSLKSSQRSKITIAAETEVRAPTNSTQSSASTEVSRADLHALLCRGALSLSVGDSMRCLDDVHVFLVAEQLASLAAQVMTAQRAGQSMLRRVSIADAQCGVQLDQRGRVTVLIGDGDGDSQAWRLPSVSTGDFARAVVSFGRRLSKHILDADRSQRGNLRLTTFRRSLRDLSERLRGGSGAEPKLNDSPESYRAFAESAEPPSVAPKAQSMGKLRFAQSWRADVPGIDLRSMFIAGERLIVGSSRELACIERNAGHLLWTKHTPRAVSIMTPVGVARLSADGRLCLHDINDGETLFQLQLGACVGASTSGAVINAPGLPHMLLVAEGARHLVAVDLDSSQIRWRRAVRTRVRDAARRPLRLRRAGKLMLVSGGEANLLALDLLTGEVVWRHCGKRRYGAVVVDRGAVFAFSSEVYGRQSRATLQRFDPWTGEVAWSTTLPRPVATFGKPLVSGDAVALLTRDDDRDGLRTGVIVVDREDGSVRLDMRGTLCDGHGGCLVIDDTLIANSESGELVAVSLKDGATKYRHVFAGWSSRFHPADRPRSVQPILRSGALFLPQSEVYVVRPHDGAMLGRLPSDLIPDALRVDERCGVYIAEASGYLAAYHALPSLTLVRPT